MSAVEFVSPAAQEERSNAALVTRHPREQRVLLTLRHVALQAAPSSGDGMMEGAAVAAVVADEGGGDFEPVSPMHGSRGGDGSGGGGGGSVSVAVAEGAASDVDPTIAKAMGTAVGAAAATPAYLDGDGDVPLADVTSSDMMGTVARGPTESVVPAHHVQFERSVTLLPFAFNWTLRRRGVVAGLLAVCDVVFVPALLLLLATHYRLRPQRRTIFEGGDWSKPRRLGFSE